MGVAGRLLAAAMLLAVSALSAIHAYGGQEHFSVFVPALYLDGAANSRQLFEAAAADGTTLSLIATKRVAHETLQRAPMDSSALVYAGYFAAKNGDLARANRALALGLRRNPRNVFAHMWALEAAAGRRDFSAAVQEVDTLIVIDPASAERYLDYLIILAADEGSYEAIQKMIASRPRWSAAFVRRIERSSSSEALLARLAGVEEGALHGLLGRMIAQNRVEEAFVVWMDNLRVRTIGFEWPYDGDFRGAPGGAPFNWSLRNNDVELQPRGGLSVSYRGSRGADLAEQITLLASGSYGLAVQAKGQSQSRGNFLRWIVTCFPSGVEVARVDVRPIERAKVFGVAFTIPAADCPAQKLSLRGVPGELPIDVSATIASVKFQQ